MGAKIFDGQKWVDVYDTITDNYSLLLVSTTDESFIGKTVTVTATGEGAKREEYTKRFTALNAQPFFRLNQLTTYSVTCGDVTRTIEVTEYANYSAVISPVPSAGYLYDGSRGEAGATGANVCADITGGYNVRNQNQIYWNADNVTLKANSYANGQNIKTVNAIDFTGFSHLKFEISGDYTCGIASSASATDNNFVATGTDIDLANYQGSYYVAVRVSRDKTAVVTKIWLE